MDDTVCQLSSDPRPATTSGTSTASPHHQPDESRLLVEQVRLLYESLPAALVATVACVAALVVVDWQVVPHGVLAVWLAAMVMIAAGRWGLVRAFHRADFKAGIARPWERMFLVGTILAGVGWGATAWIFFPPASQPHQLFLAFVLGGISAGAATTLAARFSAFLCFAVPTLLPITFRFLTHDGPHAGAMALYIMIFTGLITYVAFRMAATAAHTVRLRFENAALIDQLLGQINRDRRLELQQAALYELAKDPAFHSGHPRQAFPAITERVARTVNVERASIWLFDDPRASLVLHDLYEATPKQHTNGVRLPVSRYPAYFHALETEPYALNAHDARTDPRTREFVQSYLAPLGIGAMLDAPIRRHGQVIGVVCLEHVGTIRTWSGEEQIFAASVATMVTIALDADGRRRFQERLEQQFRQSQKMEAVGRLAGGVAHDFNNLLTVINGCSALLLDRLPAEDPQRMLVEETLKAGERGADLTKQLLAFSRQQVLKLEVLDLNAALRAITKLIERLIGEDITLTITLDPELWPIHADRVQIDQVLMNLAVNARDAMPEGGQVTIETRNTVVTPETRVPHPVFTPGEYVHLAVRDSGSGMDQETLTHIFEPFFTTKQEGHGTGLGLATVYGIVKQSRGFIFVDSAQRQGATFNLYFPRMEPQAAATPAASAMPSTTGSERVLVVEDQGSVRQLIVQALKSYGYEVFEAANGEEALRRAATLSEPVQALVTDVIMPQIAGPVIAERLRAFWPGLRVLFVSGYTERFKPTFLNLPGTLFIQKPFLPAELAAKLRCLLDE